MSRILIIPEPAESRIIRMTNVHYGVQQTYLEEFFDGYVIEDTFRIKNMATDKRDVVYILFATVAERIRASEMEGQSLLGRKVRIQPVPGKVNYQLNDDRTAFMRTRPDKQNQTVVPDAEEGSSKATPNVANTKEFPSLGGGQDQKAHPQPAGGDVQILVSETKAAAELAQDAPSDLAGPPSKDSWD